VVLGICSVVVGAAPGEPRDRTSHSPHVYLADATARGAVRRAVLGASLRLGRPSCQRIFTDFADESGKRLLANLEATTSTAPEYLLDRIWFVDGSDTPQCRHDTRTAAFTAAGDKVVRVCADRFASRFATETTAAEVIIIHELLHTLGLGENPPSTWEITRVVTKRCGGGCP
jgi:hypothetical protein